MIIVAIRWYLRYALFYRDVEGHCCIEGKDVLFMAQSSESCSPCLAENYGKPDIGGLLRGF